MRSADDVASVEVASGGGDKAALLELKSGSSVATLSADESGLSLAARTVRLLGGGVSVEGEGDASSPAPALRVAGDKALRPELFRVSPHSRRAVELRCEATAARIAAIATAVQLCDYN